MTATVHTLSFLQRNNARVIADSILNLRRKKLISSPTEDPSIAEQLGAEGYRIRHEGTPEDPSIAGQVGAEASRMQQADTSVDKLPSLAVAGDNSN